MRQAKTQNNLRIRTVSSDSSQGTDVAKDQKRL